MGNHETLRDDAEVLAVKVNLAAFTARMIIRGNADAGALIAWNGPYYVKSGKHPLPVGSMYDCTSYRVPCFNFGYPRPRIDTSLFGFEAGPLLVRDGSATYDDNKLVHASRIIGKFQFDVLRRTSHLCIGTTKPGKLIVAYAADAWLQDCADLMEDLGCHYAINCDGGHSAGLRIGSVRRGADPILFGIELYPRSKA
jgi:hypothetical protein